MKIFQERLKEALKAKKLSQRRLAELIGVKQATIYYYMHKDAPSLERFKQICEVVGVSADYLLELNINNGGGGIDF